MRYLSQISYSVVHNFIEQCPTMDFEASVGYANVWRVHAQVSQGDHIHSFILTNLVPLLGCTKCEYILRLSHAQRIGCQGCHQVELRLHAKYLHVRDWLQTLVVIVSIDKTSAMLSLLHYCYE